MTEQQEHDAMNKVVKAACRVANYFHKQNSNCLIILPDEEDAFQVAGFAITRAINQIGSKDCVLFLCDGGTQKAIEAENVFKVPFIRWVYVINIGGKILTKLRRGRRKELSASDIHAPLVAGATTYFVKRIKQRIIDLSDRTMDATVLGIDSHYNIRRSIIFSKYLFLHSPKSKLFAIGELRKYGIPITCIGTDADIVAINMLKDSLKTDFVFGFTKESINRIAPKIGLEKELLDDKYKKFEMVVGVPVKSDFGVFYDKVRQAQNVLQRAPKDERETKHFEKLKSVFKKLRKDVPLLIASSVPPVYVTYYSGLMQELDAVRGALRKIYEETMETEMISLRSASILLDNGLALLQVELGKREKLEAIKSYLESNSGFKMVAWYKSEAEAASRFFGSVVTPVKEISNADKLLFGGFRSSWKFLDAVRHAKPAKVSLVSWDVEVQEYNDFAKKYLQASEFLLQKSIELANVIKKEKTP
jgi:hypothetical protein